MRSRLIDLLFLLALGVFVFAIPPTFHGDEAMQIYMSRDYTTAFIERDPAALKTEPPYPPDSDEQLRLINGSVNRYAIGLITQLAGLSANDLPHPGWDWGLDYGTNVNTGHFPPDALLAAGRFSSTLFLALSAFVMFALGWQFGKRPLAYVVSALYVVNPVILLNGRRALQEGSMLFFGLLAILIAALISQRRAAHKRDPIWLWVALVLAGGLTLASKHTGAVFVAGAFGWLFVAELTTRPRDLVITTGKLVVAGALAIVLFVALSPALWSDPPARIVNLLQTRAELLDIQANSDPDAPMTLAERVEAIIREPFIAPPQFYEVAFWATFKRVTDEVDRYMASPFSGVQFGVILGGILTALAGVGVFFSLRRGICAGLLTWLALTLASLLANPLPWQRYYLPLIPVATLLAGIGLYGLVRRFVWKPEQGQALNHAPSESGSG